MVENVTDWDFPFENGTKEIQDDREWPGRYYPSWSNVTTSKFGFMLHAYGFACSFTVLAFYAFFSVLNIRSLVSIRPFMASINVFLCLLGASRAIVLFIDPYALRDVMPKAMAGAIFDVGTASVTSAVCLTHLALVDIAQIKLKFDIFTRENFLNAAITLHYSCLLASDLSIALQHRFSYALKIIIETVFLLWGVTISGMFIHAAQRAMVILRTMPPSMFDRDIDPEYKGIMQLSVIAPYTNLAGSVASALIPTLLTPNVQKEAVDVPSSSSSCKREPMKSSIMKHVGQGPKSADGDDPRLCSTVQKTRGTKKLSWGTEQRCVDKPSQKGINDKKNGIEEEDDVTANTTLLPPQNFKVKKTERYCNSQRDTELTLDAILNHIAYMSRDRSYRCSGAGKRKAVKALYVAGLSGGISGGLLGLQLVALYLPAGLIYDGDRRWLCYETICRILEILTAWGVANLSKQPVNERDKSPSRHGIFM